MLDGGFPRGALNYWKSQFLSSLSDDAIRAMIECFACCPTPMGALFLEHFHGAVSRIGVTDTAFPYREEGFNLLVLAEWMDRKGNDACIAWARNSSCHHPAVYGAQSLRQLSCRRRTRRCRVAAYGPNYRRLQQIKAKFDPDNVFRVNHNISPVA